MAAFREISNPAPPKIRRLAMTCDQKLCDSIPAPLPNESGARWLIVGPPGSGKSTFACSQLVKGGAYHRKFDALFVVCPPNSVASFRANPFSGHNKLWPELTAEALDAIIKQAKEMASKGRNSLVFIDDSAFLLKEKAIAKRIGELFFNARHLKTSVWVVAQTMRSIPHKVRLAASHLLFFQPSNRLESATIASEFVSLDQKSAAQLFEQCFQAPHSHCFVDVARRKVYHDWNELVIPRSY